MPSLKAQTLRRKSIGQKTEFALREALARVDEPFLAESLSVFFAHLARAQRQGDEAGVHEAHRAIVEAMRGIPDGPIDEPLLPSLRRVQRKRRK